MNPAAAAVQCFDVFDSQNIVGAGNHGYVCRQLRIRDDQRVGTGSGIGISQLELLQQNLFILFGLLQKDIRELGQKLDIRTFAAKAQIIYHAKVVQHGDGSPGKVFCAAGGKAAGQFQHQVGTAGEGGPGAGILVEQRRVSPLYKITAHDDDDIIGIREQPGLIQVIGMPQMERIVFRNNSTYFHNNTLPFLTQYGVPTPLLRATEEMTRRPIHILWRQKRW